MRIGEVVRQLAINPKPIRYYEPSGPNPVPFGLHTAVTSMAQAQIILDLRLFLPSKEQLTGICFGHCRSQTADADVLVVGPPTDAQRGQKGDCVGAPSEDLDAGTENHLSLAHV